MNCIFVREFVIIYEVGMEKGLFALIPEERLRDVLDALHQCTDLPVRLLDEQGRELASFGEGARCCAILRERVFRSGECLEAHRRAGEQSRRLGEAYIFSCRASGTPSTYFFVMTSATEDGDARLCFMRDGGAVVPTICA